MTAHDVENTLVKYASAEDALFLQHYFKTGDGQYGQGDVFIGVRVPSIRIVCKQFKDLPVDEIEKLLSSKIHEHRLAAVIILGNRFKKLNEHGRKEVYEFYLKALDNGYINNWDIVDSSAEFVVGEYLWGKQNRDALLYLARHDDVWHRRVAMLSTFAFIKKGEPTTALRIAEVLLHDKHDLIQKAVGWMLREVGKRIDCQLLIDFLEKHYTAMPRTMLRYAIEHLSTEQQIYFMKKDSSSGIARNNRSKGE